MERENQARGRAHLARGVMKPTAWTNQWIRELPWRTVRKINSDVLKDGLPSGGIERSRAIRVQAEWSRRKREGGGGLVAELERARESIRVARIRQSKQRNRHG